MAPIFYRQIYRQTGVDVFCPTKRPQSEITLQIISLERTFHPIDDVSRIVDSDL
jgi:hypothetical protein